MKSTDVVAGVTKGRASQYNDLRADARAASYLRGRAASTPDNKITIDEGHIYFGDTRVAYAGGQTSAISAPSSNPRIDNISITISGVIVSTQGTEDATPENTKATTPVGNYPICEVYCRTTGTVVKDTDDSTNHYIYKDLRKTQTLIENDFGVDTGVANAYEVEIVGISDPYVLGKEIRVQITTANTGASTLAVNGGTPKDIKRYNSTTDLSDGDLPEDVIATFVYDGTNWQLRDIIPATPAGILLGGGNADILHTHALLVNKFGGTGEDGAQGDADLTITGSNNTYIVKNFTSWAAGSVARTCTVTPTGCVVHIKIKENADFTNWAFNFAGKGGQGGAGGAIGADGTDAATPVDILVVSPTAGKGGKWGDTNQGGGGGGGGASYWTNGTDGHDQLLVDPSGKGGAGGDAPTPQVFLLAGVMGTRSIVLSPAMGGGGGGGVKNAGGVTGGAGGAGGGALIIEVGGNIVFSSTTINANGVNGSDGETGGGNIGGGGGGGGGGGAILIMYNGTATSTPTTNVLAGSGGAGPNYGGAGEVGGVGKYALLKNTVF